MGNSERVKNRMFSIFCVVLFVIGLALVGLVGAKLISDSIEQNKLLNIRDELLEEKERQDNVTDDEDYYTVYVKDNYSIYDEEETIFVFTK